MPVAAGFAVGAVKKAEVVTGDDIAPGDVLIGMPSTGVHSNGFSLVRKVSSTRRLTPMAPPPLNHGAAKALPQVSFAQPPVSAIPSRTATRCQRCAAPSISLKHPREHAVEHSREHALKHPRALHGHPFSHNAQHNRTSPLYPAAAPALSCVVVAVPLMPHSWGTPGHPVTVLATAPRTATCGACRCDRTER